MSIDKEPCVETILHPNYNLASRTGTSTRLVAFPFLARFSAGSGMLYFIENNGNALARENKRILKGVCFAYVSSDQNPDYFMFIGDYTTLLYRDYTVIGHYKDPYESTSIMESKDGFSSWRMWAVDQTSGAHQTSPGSDEAFRCVFFVLVCSFGFSEAENQRNNLKSWNHFAAHKWSQNWGFGNVTPLKIIYIITIYSIHVLYCSCWILTRVFF